MVRRVVIALMCALIPDFAAATERGADFDPADFPIIESIDLSTWSRAFVGVHAGHASRDLTVGFEASGVSGWLVGLDAGINIYLGQGVLLGVAADLSRSDVAPEPGDTTLAWTGSARGRLALDGGQFLPYLTAGPAVGFAEIAAGESATLWGWTAGAGVEVAVDDVLSIDTAWRYTELGADSSSNLDYQQLTIGVNWAIR
jgi:opacity protein-like surface antigen